MDGLFSFSFIQSVEPQFHPDKKIRFAAWSKLKLYFEVNVVSSAINRTLLCSMETEMELFYKQPGETSESE